MTTMILIVLNTITMASEYHGMPDALSGVLEVRYLFLMQIVLNHTMGLPVLLCCSACVALPGCSVALFGKPLVCRLEIDYKSLP
jgi:hypothetical protein